MADAKADLLQIERTGVFKAFRAPQAAAQPNEQLQQLNEVGAMLSVERDPARLLERVLSTAQRVTGADAGAVYLLEREGDRQSLRLAVAKAASLGLSLTSAFGGGLDVDAIPLPAFAPARPRNATVHAALTRQPVNLNDVTERIEFDLAGTEDFDRVTRYHSRSLLIVPILGYDGEPIGVLHLINCISAASGRVGAFGHTEQRVAESLASQAALAISNQRLLLQLEKLFESLITLINAAIDEKSPYTGGHCQRVPVLTMQLAEAAHRTEHGRLASFRMSERDRYELRIAGMLHDCGKITTPVHVVDKSAKLETIFDRIHLIDARFEVVKRDARIAALEEKLQVAGADRLIDDDRAARIAAIDARLAETLAAIDADRDFLREANIGSEAMSPYDQDRVRAIAARHSWVQSGDDGGEQRPILSPDEIENLTVPYGTLTAAERQTINSHIDSTIRMLEALPWPEHLRNVPAYAGAHHERIDGKGYPRGLSGAQMPVQARIMAIADIFEALTAPDRPYKSGKSLAEAVTILGRMTLKGHIDPDLFDVFVREKVYLQYAIEYMEPAQIDEVDEAAIPGYQP